MKVRADVAELLRAGHSNRAIARQLHTDAKDVAEARERLGLPKAKSGVKAAASVEDLFWRRVQPVGEGHILWTGHRNNGGAEGGCPVLRHGGKLWSAYRVAFTIRHGREPQGKVTPTCDRDGCVAPDHTQDRAIREQEKRVDALYAGIFGGEA
ncbi:hypothetical protein [Cellulosimicrobium funkei]|uniref:hypothetical protein n=1 Tax=Cellulosimicrobium funkei TaxID=264251 RepID=UPI0036F9024C